MPLVAVTDGSLNTAVLPRLSRDHCHQYGALMWGYNRMQSKQAQTDARCLVATPVWRPQSCRDSASYCSFLRRRGAASARQCCGLILLLLLLVPWAAGALTPAQYVQLKTELTTDPLVPPMGYNVTPTFYVTNNNDAALADMLNAIGTTAAFQVSNVITNVQLWNAAMSADLDNLPTPKRTLLQIALQVA